MATKYSVFVIPDKVRGGKGGSIKQYLVHLYKGNARTPMSATVHKTLKEADRAARGVARKLGLHYVAVAGVGRRVYENEPLVFPRNNYKKWY